MHSINKEKRQVLDAIPHAQGAGWDEKRQQAKRCVDGTRQELLREIKEWVEGIGDARVKEKTGFWLQGLAGTGKSTVARTVAEDLYDAGYVVASFFFRRGEEGRSSTDLFVTTILRQLAGYPELFEPLIKRFNETETGAKLLAREWRRLIKEPLDSISHRMVVLVIDAVDESKDMMALQDEMFDFLSEPSNFDGCNLRVFVTARPHVQGKSETETLHHLFHLHKIPENVVEDDLRKFFRIEFKALYNDSGFPEEEHIRGLAERSKPLFIAAKTSFEFITNNADSPRNQYRLLMNSKKQDSREELEDLEEAYVALDEMYLTVIKQALATKSPKGRHTISANRFRSFRLLIGSIITLHEGFDYESLALLLSVEAFEVSDFLNSFRPVLDIPKSDAASVHIFHQSFPDFLKSRTRVKLACSGQQVKHDELWIDEAKVNTELFKACIRLMNEKSTGLKEDICDLVSPGYMAKNIQRDVLEKRMPRALRYACRHWANHFVAAFQDEKLYVQLFEFLEKHLLHWIEAMSCLGCFSDVIRQLNKVHGSIKVSPAYTLYERV